MHLRRAWIREANVDARSEKRPRQRFRTIHGRILAFVGMDLHRTASPRTASLRDDGAERFTAELASRPGSRTSIVARHEGRMSRPDVTLTKILSAALSEQRAKAEAQLRREMEALGLYEKDGWRIVDFTREVAGGTQLVLRPLHLSLASPAGIQCVVDIVEDDGRLHVKSGREAGM